MGNRTQLIEKCLRLAQENLEKTMIFNEKLEKFSEDLEKMNETIVETSEIARSVGDM